MKIKALIPFSGAVTMAAGQIGDVPDALAEQLIKAGYAEKYVDPGGEEAVSDGDNKRGKSKQR